MIRLDASGLRRLGLVFIGTALAVLAASYLAIAIHAGGPLIWSVPVHEDGVRTFGDTVLYYEHASRELPLDLLLAVAIGGGAYYGLPRSTALDARGAQRTAAWLIVGSALVMAVIVAGAAVTVGVPSLVENLLQNHTRPGAPLFWGSHWRYHLLERLGFIALSTGFAGLLRAITTRADDDAGSNGQSLVLICVTLFAIFTAVFSSGVAGYEQVFLDPQYLGHQAREVMTHAVVTVPIAWGACLLLASRIAAPDSQAFAWGRIVPPLAWAVAGMILCLYVVFAAMASDAASHGQSMDIVTLVFPHYFEHSFTYLLTPLLAGAVYLLCALSDRAHHP